jgi:hypothetical protein
MTMVSTKAARDRAFPAEIRQSSLCQQEKQWRAAAAVGGHHEKGERVHSAAVGRVGAARPDRIRPP